MSPEKARVAIIEDDPDYISTLTELIEMGGHTVVATATSLEAAKALVKRFKELGVQVATVDGNLSEWDDKGVDGRSIIAAIQQFSPQVKTIGLSSNSMPSADLDLGKRDSYRIHEEITRL